WLIDEDGTKLCPIKMRNRNSGRLAFRIAPGSTNITSKQSEVDDLAEVFEAVVVQGHGIRVTAGEGEARNIRSLGGRIQGYGMENGLLRACQSPGAKRLGS
ncbi:MAG: hypothetical protein ACLP8A_18510, partial [Methylovirgula sp.]